jgi:SAM-dependent methyltransferase
MSNLPAPQGSFDLNTVFEVDDYMFVYGNDLTDKRSDAEVAWVVRLLELDSPLKILEMARQQAKAMGVQVDYRQGDMRQLSFNAEFDRVLLLFTSFGYFGDDENLQVAENMARALKPGGLLGFDIPNRDVIAGEPPTSAVIDKNGDLIINRLSFEVHTGRFHNRRIIVRNGVRRDKPFSIRLYNVQEIRALLGRVGLEVAKVLGDDDQPLSAQSRRLVVIARKPLQA